jgi:Na+/H+ antiporter NhaA
VKLFTLLHLLPRMRKFTTVPLLLYTFHGVDTDSFTLHFAEIPIKLDIQMAFCLQKNVAVIHLLDMCGDLFCFHELNY